MTERAYSSDQIREVIDVSYKNLDYWARTGVVKPSIAGARGSGTARRWSATDVSCLAAVAALRRLGVSLDLARRVVPLVREEPALRWVYVAGDVVGTCDATMLEAIVSEFGVVAVVDLDRARIGTSRRAS